MTEDFTELIDLASERLGGAVLYANDEFFAPKENLLKASAPVFIEGKYTERGKWMDGWESRRRRTPGFDWCLVRLGLPGRVRGVVVDTSFFRGNYPESCSLEACALPGTPGVEELTGDGVEWREILPESPLQGDSQNRFEVNSEERFTHLRFRIYPDGGVARLRVYGEAAPDWRRLLGAGGLVDLAAAEHGGLVVATSDEFFGRRNNLIMPGRGVDMGDGWETKRRRGPGYDWAVIRLAAAGTLKRVEVDTNHFKGNYPESFSLEVCHADSSTVTPDALQTLDWREVIPRTRLQAHTRHFYDELADAGEATHARLNIYPDGGVSRLRLYGTVSTQLPVGR
ncbi:MAG TPA: allantoicase [Pyrinomonadaceae bacterium]|jgi:allantoicase|nr:allantoicase [Pyrinomonadaceae bacterium]